MGSVIKVIVIYDKPYWRLGGFSGEAISDQGPMCDLGSRAVEIDIF